jgi:hypothetical protein
MHRLQMLSPHLIYAVFSPLISWRIWRVVAMAIACGAVRLLASDAETIGLTAMRRERPAINGAGIRVAQPEGQEATNAWQVNPAINASAVFTWTSDQGTTTNFPNSVGLESGHANGVGTLFFGTSSGIAPGVPSVDSYDADYFMNVVVTGKQPIKGQVVNQSFIVLVPTPTVDPAYDSYAAMYNVLFVSGMNNIPDTPPSPGTAYNGMGVGFISPGAQSSIGPTVDGRAKPDIVAPQCCSSYSTPLVAGAAVLLLQAGAANDGGAGTASLATNSATVKALLLNGAVKTTNWTNGVTRPLDARYGAGVLNIYNSDLQLRGGRRVASATNNVTLNAPHPPTGETNNVASLRGWDFSSIQSGPLNDRVAHYYFDLPASGAAYSATATLVWTKGDGPLANLDFFLFETRSNTIVTQSTSGLDNVQHIFVPRLPAGRYDLQVLKHGGLQAGTESYALAFDFSPVKLTSVRSGGSVLITWPASPAGFTLQAASSLNSPVWQNVGNEPVLSNSMNTVALPASATMQFLRLFRP